MDVNTLRDLLQLLPDTLCVSKSLLKPYFGDKPPEYSFIINDSSFYDHVGKHEDTDSVIFEVFKEERVLDTADVVEIDEKAAGAQVVEIVEGTENASSKPELAVEKVEDGVIVNSKTYLKDQNWNTLLSLDGLFQCAVCDKIMTPDAVDPHISTDTHKINWDRCRPLTEYELSVVRKIEYYYHCGVCNLLTIHISDHIDTETHKQSLMYAVNKALAIINKKLDNIESTNDETKAEVINGPTADSPVDSAAVIAIETDLINAPINSSVDNEIVIKNTNKHSPVKTNSPNKIRNLAVPSPDNKKNQNNKTSKKPFPNLSPVKKNVQATAFKLTPDAFPNLIPNGLTMNPISNSAENLAFKSDPELNPLNPNTSNLTENSAPQSTSEIKQGASKLLGNKVDNQNTVSYASAAKKVVNQNPEFVYHEYKDRTVKAKYDSWHMILKRRNKTFYCMACPETNINDKMLHCSSDTHVQNLDKCTIVNAYEDFFIRKVGDKFFHCGHCNNLQYPPDMTPHIAKMHPCKQTQTEKNAKKPEPVRIEYVANAKNVNIDAMRRSGTPESTKSSDSARTTDSTLTNPKKPANIFTSEIKICPFDMELTLNVLYYNTVFMYTDKLVCALCDCYVQEDPVQHICGTRHTEILRRSPFITSYNNNLIREVRDKLHCALCNTYIPHENIFTHIMNPPHTSLLARSATLAQMRNTPQMRPPVPQIRPPAPQPRLPGPVLTYTPTVQVPNMNTVTNAMCSWWQSVPRFMRNHVVPMIPCRAPMVFPGSVPGPAFNPYPYHRYASPIMPVQNAVVAVSTPNIANARVPEKIESEQQKIELISQDDVSKCEPKPDVETSKASAKKKEKCTMKTKDKPKKSDNRIVKESKKTKKDSPAKKKSVINEIKRSVDQLKALEIKNDEDDENVDVSKEFNDGTKKTNTFGNEETSLIKIDNTIRQRKSFSEVAKMPPKDISLVKSDVSAVTRLPLEKHKITWDENNMSRETTPPKSDNSLKIVDVLMNKKVLSDVNKNDPNTSVTMTNEWPFKEQDTDEKYDLSEFTLVSKKKNGEFKEKDTVLDKIKCTEDSCLTIVTEKSNEQKKDKIEITLDDIKLVSELYEPVEQNKDINENKKPKVKEVTMEKNKVTFDDNKGNPQKEKAKENEPSKNKLNVEENKKTKQANKSDVVKANDTEDQKKPKMKASKKDKETKVDSKMERAESIDEPVSTIQSTTNTNDNSDDFDMEEFIYLNLKSFIAKITFSSYNSLVPVGDGTRYCFVCWEQVFADLNKHVESNKHLENMKSSKYMDHYNDNMIRWKNSTHHCSVCNVIITGSLQTHLSWQHHAATLLETKKTVRQLTKDMKKTNYRQFKAVTTKKNYTCANQVKFKKSICDNNFF